MVDQDKIVTAAIDFKATTSDNNHSVTIQVGVGVAFGDTASTTIGIGTPHIMGGITIGGAKWAKKTGGTYKYRCAGELQKQIEGSQK